ncbi:flagellin [Defluviimonas salinarum]|uniref:Flagellin n=1 Tax=Defluviimonas salinarum TaxID=2992147 RepID=A0ABT3J3S9_9RHOB|nr:flagellin [Defluviimonas salinarum]MCW3782049.1 flagellin [Defluviimonas salinarum]
MTTLSIGDMARAFQMRRQNTELQRTLTRLSEELTSGVKSDLATAVSGDYTALAGIDRSLETLSAYRTATSEAALFTETLQTALGTAQDLSTDLAPGLLTAATNGAPTLVDTAAGDARQKFHAAVSALNTQIADRFLLSGAATDRKPISGSQEILDALMAATAGEVTASGVTAAAQAWFDAPAGGGGYLDTVYGGSAAGLAPFRVGPGDTVTLDITAADPDLRDLVRGLALGALVAEGALAGDPVGRAALVKTAGETLLAANDRVAGLRTRIGTVEAHIAHATTRNDAEASALNIARTAIVAADPYETASALEAIQTQIETLYTLTARLSRLTLADYLR